MKRNESELRTKSPKHTFILFQFEMYFILLQDFFIYFII